MDGWKLLEIRMGVVLRPDLNRIAVLSSPMLGKMTLNNSVRHSNKGVY